MNNKDIIDILKKKSGVVLIPTDTNYALAANAFDEVACGKIYAFKNRDVKKPLTLFINKPIDIYKYTKLSTQEQKIVHILISKYWPGPFNIIVPKAHDFPINKFIDNETISIACNQCTILNDILAKINLPLAMSSANISGVSNDTLITMMDAKKEFGDLVDVILESNISNDKATISSTIVSIVGGKINVIRQGDIVLNKEIYNLI